MLTLTITVVSQSETRLVNCTSDMIGQGILLVFNFGLIEGLFATWKERHPIPKSCQSLMATNFQQLLLICSAIVHFFFFFYLCHLF